MFNSIRMSWEKIGSGYEGDVYLSPDRTYIKKIVHIPDDAKTPCYKYSVWREIEFSMDARNHPRYFVDLISYSIVDYCKYKKDKPEWLKDPNEIKEWKATQNTNL